MERKKAPPATAAEAVPETPPIKRKRGRPKSSPYDLATQKKLNNRRYRQARREDNEIAVEIYLPKAWHEWLVSEGATLREVAVEAFAAWLEKRGFPAHATGEPPPANKA